MKRYFTFNKLKRTNTGLSKFLFVAYLLALNILYVFVRKKTNTKAILVLGMHRSGTSLLTGMLKTLGIELGSPLVGAGESNEKGHFELKDLLRINKGILLLNNSAWDSVKDFEQSYNQDSLQYLYKIAIKYYVLKHFADSDVFAFKDPRTSLLLPLYFEALNDLGIECKCIIVLRSTNDIARSLARRNGLPYSDCVELIDRYTNAIDKYVVGHPAMRIKFNEIVDHPDSACQRLLSFLPPRKPIDFSLVENVVNFVDPKLRHNIER